MFTVTTHMLVHINTRQQNTENSEPTCMFRLISLPLLCFLFCLEFTVHLKYGDAFFRTGRVVSNTARRSQVYFSVKFACSPNKTSTIQAKTPVTFSQRNLIKHTHTQMQIAKYAKADNKPQQKDFSDRLYVFQCASVHWQFF